VLEKSGIIFKSEKSQIIKLQNIQTCTKMLKCYVDSLYILQDSIYDIILVDSLKF
jgi:sulfur relay (sulfurtransferase) DsrF/TusC family protein